MSEYWVRIDEMIPYDVSSIGNVRNSDSGKVLSQSVTKQGDLKVNLRDNDGERITASVRVLVAEAFLDRPDDNCDTVVILDGDRRHVNVNNLAWRPRNMAWKFTKQFDTPFEDLPATYTDYPIVDIVTGVLYQNIVHACIENGLLFDTVFRHAREASLPTAGPRALEPLYPTNCVFAYPRLIDTPHLQK